METITLTDDAAAGLELELAGMGSRAYAYLVDWHIRVIAGLVLMGLDWVLAEVMGLPPTSAAGGLMLTLGPPALLYSLYHPVLEAGWDGWTPGKHLAHVGIVGADGRPLSSGGHLMRNLFRLIDSLPALYALGLSFAMFHPRQLRIGDTATGAVAVLTPSRSRTALQQARAGMQSEQLSSDQYAWTLDLLARWQTLARERRVALGERFLESIGCALPDPGPVKKREQRVKEELRRLTQDGS